MSSIKLETKENSTDENFIIQYKENVKDGKRRLDLILRKDSKTGRPIGPAWKAFGHKGPRYHDGFLYGVVDEKLHMTGKYFINSTADGTFWNTYLEN